MTSNLTHMQTTHTVLYILLMISKLCLFPIPSFNWYCITDCKLNPIQGKFYKKGSMETFRILPLMRFILVSRCWRRLSQLQQRLCNLQLYNLSITYNFKQRHYIRIFFTTVYSKWCPASQSLWKGQVITGEGSYFSSWTTAHRFTALHLFTMAVTSSILLPLLDTMLVVLYHSVFVCN